MVQEPFGSKRQFCANCGQSLEENTRFCPNCGAAVQAVGAPPAAETASGAPSGARMAGHGYAHVPNYLVQAILVTIFCCLPFGIIAIVYAAQVNGKLASGDYAGAVRASGTAKTWCWASFGVVAGVIVLAIGASLCTAVIGA